MHVFVQSNLSVESQPSIYDVIVDQKKFQFEKESSVSMGGAIIFLTLFPQNYIYNYTIWVDLATHTRKREKRMPDIIVKTTVQAESEEQAN